MASIRKEKPLKPLLSRNALFAFVVAVIVADRHVSIGRRKQRRKLELARFSKLIVARESPRGTIYIAFFM
jgi:hypothetical protein